VRLEGLGKLKTFNDFIENRTRDLADFRVATQPVRYSVPPLFQSTFCNNPLYLYAAEVILTPVKFNRYI
jgi:hypothetical protein